MGLPMWTLAAPRAACSLRGRGSYGVRDHPASIPLTVIVCSSVEGWLTYIHLLLPTRKSSSSWFLAATLAATSTRRGWRAVALD